MPAPGSRAGSSSTFYRPFLRHCRPISWQVTRPLAPHDYSIASSRRDVGEEAHLLISAVRYQSVGRLRKGVASGYVADQLKKGQRLRVKLRPNRHFALPAPDRDIIMIGPGTGIAPFRAFV